jgi:hypothetical protein
MSWKTPSIPADEGAIAESLYGRDNSTAKPRFSFAPRLPPPESVKDTIIESEWRVYEENLRQERERLWPNRMKLQTQRLERRRQGNELRAMDTELPRGAERHLPHPERPSLTLDHGC